jgi:hypothetical protein
LFPNNIYLLNYHFTHREITKETDNTTVRPLGRIVYRKTPIVKMSANTMPILGGSPLGNGERWPWDGARQRATPPAVELTTAPRSSLARRLLDSRRAPVPPSWQLASYPNHPLTKDESSQVDGFIQPMQDPGQVAQHTSSYGGGGRELMSAGAPWAHRSFIFCGRLGKK